MPTFVVDVEFDHKLAHTEQKLTYIIYRIVIINTSILNQLHHFYLLHEI